MAGSSRLTVADAARILDRSTEQVRRYLREGVLPGERIGNQWFISQADLDHMLETRQRGASLAELILAADRDPLGAVIGGVIIGIAQEVSTPFVGFTYKIAIGFVVMLLVLLVRPEGLFVARARVR